MLLWKRQNSKHRQWGEGGSETAPWFQSSDMSARIVRSHGQFNKHSPTGWRDGSVHKSTCYVSRTEFEFPAPMQKKKTLACLHVSVVPVLRGRDGERSPGSLPASEPNQWEESGSVRDLSQRQRVAYQDTRHLPLASMYWQVHTHICHTYYAEDKLVSEEAKQHLETFVMLAGLDRASAQKSLASNCSGHLQTVSVFHGYQVETSLYLGISSEAGLVWAMQLFS